MGWFTKHDFREDHFQNLGESSKQMFNSIADFFFHLSLVYSRVKTRNASDFHGCLHGYKWGYKQFSWCYFTDIHNWYFDVFWTITAQTGHHSADFLISQAVEAHLLSLLP